MSTFKKILLAAAALLGANPALASGAICTFQTQILWAGATQTLFQIQNTGTEALADWGITIEYPEGYTVVNHWQTTRGGENPYTFSSPSGTPLQPGQAASFGFQTINSNHQPIELTLLTCGGVALGSDEDGDGVEDALDLCPNTAPGDQVDEFGCSLTEPSEEVSYISMGEVEMTGASESSFNSISSTLNFSVDGADVVFSEDFVQVYRNDQLVPASQVVYGPDFIQVNQLLANGQNKVTFEAIDDQGNLIRRNYILWAGAKNVTGSVLDANGQLIAGAEVVAKLGDDQSISAAVSSMDGTFSFEHIPTRTVIIEARTPDGGIGVAGINGLDSLAIIEVSPLNPPSQIDNNDFSGGTLDGWDIGNSPVTLIPHDPGSGAQALNTSALSAPEPIVDSQQSNKGRESLSRRDRTRYEDIMAGMQSLGNSGETSFQLLNEQNLDLRLGTFGEGPQHISRTFTTRPGVRTVAVRYRFITSEIPGGFYGTQYNDYFSVSIRSESGNVVQHSNSMNGLGLPSFDSSGATFWREESLAVDPNGETVQVDLTVANVGDGQYDSWLVVDLIEERELQITSLVLHDIDGTPLNFLSASPHAYFDGNTRVHGTITIEGDDHVIIDSVVLEVVQAGGVVATGTLTGSASATLIQQLGSNNKVEINSSEHLFNVNPAGINSQVNGSLGLRVRVATAGGEEAVYEAGNVTILRQFAGGNRYPHVGRDEDMGGDDWAKPSVASYIEGLGEDYLWNDFSNMNGGPFPPHATHQTGNDVDGWFYGYNARDAAAAQRLIDEVNASQGRVTVVYVTFSRDPTDSFYATIENVNLNDGRRAVDVFRPVAGHRTHFHFRVSD